MKIKLIRLLLLVMVAGLVSSCETSLRREINVIKLPKPVHLLYGESAPFDCVCIDEEMLAPVVKEAGRTP